MTMGETTNAAIGRRGEDLAQEFLLGEGFTIYHRNWRNGRYELDFVAERDGVLHIVEVRTRMAGSPVSPEESYTRAKFKALCRAAGYYIRLYNITIDVQFDLIAIDRNEANEFELRYIPDVMSPTW